jgi:hypothetical protein
MPVSLIPVEKQVYTQGSEFPSTNIYIYPIPEAQTSISLVKEKLYS